MTSPLRLGAKVPNSGPLPFRLGTARMAATLERVGFESIWTSDHVVFPREVKSPYPFAADGRMTWPADVDYLEPVVALSANAMPRDIQKGMEAGFFRYLTKPIKVSEFMDVLNVALAYAETHALAH